MGAKARTRRADFRKKQKRAKKEQQRALYASYRDSGANKKSKRGAIKAKRTVKCVTKRHAASACGNVGCSRCFPSLAAPKMNQAR